MEHRFKALYNEQLECFGVFVGNEIWSSTSPQLFGINATMEDLFYCSQQTDRKVFENDLEGFELITIKLIKE